MEEEKNKDISTANKKKIKPSSRTLYTRPTQGFLMSSSDGLGNSDCPTCGIKLTQ